jgi:hypothetical protein
LRSNSPVNSFRRLEQALHALPMPEDRNRIQELEAQIREMSLKLKAKDEELALAEEKLAALVSQSQIASIHEEVELQGTPEASSCATSSTSDTICLRVAMDSSAAHKIESGEFPHCFDLNSWLPPSLMCKALIIFDSRSTRSARVD